MGNNEKTENTTQERDVEALLLAFLRALREEQTKGTS
jgi:hypothetical protein